MDESASASYANDKNLVERIKHQLIKGYSERAIIEELVEEGMNKPQIASIVYDISYNLDVEANSMPAAKTVSGALTIMICGIVMIIFGIAGLIFIFIDDPQLNSIVLGFIFIGAGIMLTLKGYSAYSNKD